MELKCDVFQPAGQHVVTGGAAMASNLRDPQKLVGIILYAAYWVKGTHLLARRSSSRFCIPEFCHE